MDEIDADRDHEVVMPPSSAETSSFQPAPSVLDRGRTRRKSATEGPGGAHGGVAVNGNVVPGGRTRTRVWATIPDNSTDEGRNRSPFICTVFRRA